jgi:predicted transcriptional regulator
MASETLRLTAQIVASHASMTEMTPQELVAEIKQLYQVLAALEIEDEAVETKAKAPRARKVRRVKMEMSPEAKAVQDEDAGVFGGEDQQEFMATREG